MSNFKLDDSVIAIIDTLRSERLKIAVKKFIEFTPIDFVVNWDGAFRTAKVQHEKYEQGYSKCDGYHVKSAHQSGLAVDLVPWVNNTPLWNLEYAKALGGAFKTYCNTIGLNVQWGGDWNGNGVFDKNDFDPYHFQVID